MNLSKLKVVKIQLKQLPKNSKVFILLNPYFVIWLIPKELCIETPKVTWEFCLIITIENL